MSDTRLRQPSQLSMMVSEKIYRVVKKIDEFFHGMVQRRQMAQAQHFVHMPEHVKRVHLSRALGCTCGGRCSHCNHLIRDIWPH